MWQPTLSRTRPIYLAIVASLEQHIVSGRLRSGERLPTHRELARALQVTVGTVTKAFTEAERRGLVVSRVGRGTYALEFPEHATAGASEPKGLTDLSINTLTIEPFNMALNQVLGALSRRKSLHALLEYHPIPGMERHRSAGAKWLALRGVDARAEQIIVCSGSQEALMAALTTVTKPGDTVFTESLNYAGVKRLSDLLRLDIRGVSTDEEGLRPDALVEAAKGMRVGAILCSPTLHNPTNALMSVERRREIIAIAARLGAHVIEDDSYGHLSNDQTPTMASLDPDRCIYICGTSKSIAPGLRIGFIRSPAALFERLCEAMHATSWTSPSLMGEIATVLIEEGRAEKFLSEHRREALERLNLARGLLARPDLPPHCPSYHLWLPLPPPWRAGEFVAEVRLRGVLVSPADLFAVDRNPSPHAIRVSLGGISDRRKLTQALQIVGDALEARPRAIRSVA